ncbi:MAG: mandelate racemase, partial [bacterium]
MNRERGWFMGVWAVMLAGLAVTSVARPGDVSAHWGGGASHNCVSDAHGLPETLEEVVSYYRGRYYKLKVGGDIKADLDRLSRIASVLDAGAGDYQATFDGNEQ